MVKDPSEGELIPAVVLSTHTTGLAVIRALGAQRIPVIAVHYDRSDMGHVSRYVHHSLRAPHPEHDRDRFLELLVKMGETFGRCLLIPCDDAPLVAVAENAALLSPHHLLACPAWPVVRSTIDKPQTYQLAESLGVPTPRTILARNFSQVEEYCRTADFPCLVKPRRSHTYFERFRRKLVKVHSPAALVTAYQEAAAAGLEVMLQEYIEGPDTAGVNYNSYAWEGQPLVEFTAQKIRMSPPDSGVPSVVLSKQIPDVIPAGRRLLQALSYAGYSCIEFKQDARDGRYKLLEINARHNRSALLAVRCGINFPWLEYRHRVCGEWPAASGFREGLYWVDAARDMAAVGPYFRRGGFSLSGQLRPYGSPGVFAVWSLADPRPFLRRSAYLAARAVAAAMHCPGSHLQGAGWPWKARHRTRVV